MSASPTRGRGFYPAQSSNAYAHHLSINENFQNKSEKISELVDKVLNGSRYLTTHDSQQLCKDIAGASSCMKALELINERRINSWVINALFRKHSKGRYSDGYAVTTELFRRLNTDINLKHFRTTEISWKIFYATKDTDLNILNLAFESYHELYPKEKTPYHTCLPDSLYETYIKISGSNGLFNKALRGFDAAKEREFMKLSVYEAFIRAAGQNKEVHLALNTFSIVQNKFKIKEKNIKFRNIFAVFIQAMGRVKTIDPELMDRMFTAACDAFNTATTKDIQTADTYKNFIRTAGKHENIECATAAFKNFKNDSYVKNNVDVYNTYIHVMGKYGQIKKASKAFLKARKKEIADSVTYTTYMNSLHANGDNSEALKVFYQARDDDFEDEITYMSVINILFNMGRHEGALLAYKEMEPDLVWKRINNIASFDLHGFSHGAGCIAVNEVLKSPQRRAGEILAVIPGKGRELSGNLFKFRDVIQAHVKATFTNWTCEVSPQNSGVLYLKNQDTPLFASRGRGFRLRGRGN